MEGERFLSPRRHFIHVFKMEEYTLLEINIFRDLENGTK